MSFALRHEKPEKEGRIFDAMSLLELATVTESKKM